MKRQASLGLHGGLEIAAPCSMIRDAANHFIAVSNRLLVRGSDRAGET